ncbi:MAG: hypothetical protein MZU95_08070 [Desulfomicrobium escambiense]|nr:hypothetical protein [Desulfomicrobium escambiense]
MNSEDIVAWSVNIFLSGTMMMISAGEAGEQSRDRHRKHDVALGVHAGSTSRRRG